MSKGLKVKCQWCGGTGTVRMKLCSPRNGSQHVEYILTCPQPACKNGIVDVDEYYETQWGIKRK